MYGHAFTPKYSCPLKAYACNTGNTSNISAPEHHHRLQGESHIDKPYFTQETQNLFILLPTWQWQARDVSQAIHTYWAMHVEGFPYAATKTTQQQTENTPTNE